MGKCTQRRKVLERVTLAVFIICTSLLLHPSFAHSATSVMETIEKTLAYNPSLKARQETRIMSQYALAREKTGYLPDIDLNMSAGMASRNDQSLRGRGGDIRFRPNASADITLTQPIYNGFFTRYSVNRAKEDFKASSYDVEGSVIDLIYRAIAAHEEVVRREKLLKLSKQNLAEHQIILGKTKERFDAGVATTGDLSQIRGRYARAKASLLNAETTYTNAIASYSSLVGEKPRDLNAVPLANNKFSDVLAIQEYADNKNPTLRAALTRLDAAKLEIEQSKSYYAPTVDFVAGAYLSDNTNEDVDEHVSEVAGDILFNWNMYNGGEKKAAVNMTKAKMRAAKQDYMYLRNTLYTDMETTYNRYESAILEAEQYKNAKYQSKKTKDDFYRQFLASKRTLLDVLDAENDYFYAASQELLSYSDHVLASYRLLALTGEIFDRLDIDAQSFMVDEVSPQRP